MGFSGTATRWLVRRWVRQRRLAMVPLVLIVAGGTAGTMVALTAAQRTANSYGDYLERSDAGDVLVNPAVNTRDIDEVIRSLPNVDRISSSVLFTVSLDDGAPRTRRDLLAGSAGWLGSTYGSVDGRHIEMDRPVMRSGRMPTGANEAVITTGTVEAVDLAIGDVVPLAFWSDDVSIGVVLDGYMDELISPIGVEHLEIVGIATLADEVLPDDLYDRQRLIVSPDVTARYDCLPDAPMPGSSVVEVHQALLPPGCAVRYRFYSLSFVGGGEEVAPALEHIGREMDTLNASLADIRDLPDGEVPPTYSVFPTTADHERSRIEHAVGPTVGALLVVAAATAVVTMVLAMLAVARELRLTQPQQRQWHQLGVAGTTCAVVGATPLVIATALGAVTGMLAGWWLAPGPLGLVSVIEPHPARHLDPTAAAVALVVGVAVVVGAMVGSVRSVRSTDAPIVARSSWGARGLGGGVGAPTVTVGLRAAFAQRAAVPVVAGGALLTGVIVAALVFGASLAALVSTPRSYGWPWDVSAVTGYGYGGLDVDGAEQLLADDPEVASWTMLMLTHELSLDGEPTFAVVGLDRASNLDVSVLAGVLPRANDEVAIGPASASARGLSVGDTVEVGGAVSPPRQVTITGLVVLPSLGFFGADRLGGGYGMLVPESVLDRSPIGDVVRWRSSFVGIDLHESADTSARREMLRGQLRALDMSGFPPVDHGTAVRPPEVIDAGAARSVPITVAGAFAVAGAIGLTSVLWTSVRSRRRELAVLRALGFGNAELRRSVHVQSTATTLASLLIGAPLGLIVGRVLWRAFADRLGVIPDPASPWGPLLLAAGVAVAFSVLTAIVPAHAATRTASAGSLRTA